MSQGKKHEVDQQKIDHVKLLASLGMPQESIAKKLEISVDCLYKYYASYMAQAVDEANSKIAGTLYKKALSGDNACMMFWLKTRARWREVHHTEITGLDGAPLKFEKIQIELIKSNETSDPPSI